MITIIVKADDTGYTAHANQWQVRLGRNKEAAHTVLATMGAKRIGGPGDIEGVYAMRPENVARVRVIELRG